MQDTAGEVETSSRLWWCNGLVDTVYGELSKQLEEQGATPVTLVYLGSADIFDLSKVKRLFFLILQSIRSNRWAQHNQRQGVTPGLEQSQ